MTGAATTSGLVAMLPTFRKTGIRVMGEMPWGTHICVFYESKEDLVDTLVPYFKAGLDNNEYCVWAVSEPVNETEAAEALRQGIPGFDLPPGAREHRNSSRPGVVSRRRPIRSEKNYRRLGREAAPCLGPGL